MELLLLQRRRQPVGTFRFNFKIHLSAKYRKPRRIVLKNKLIDNKSVGHSTAVGEVGDG